MKFEPFSHFISNLAQFPAHRTTWAGGPQGRASLKGALRAPTLLHYGLSTECCTTHRRPLSDTENDDLETFEKAKMLNAKM